MEVFPSSEQKSDDTSPPKHDPCEFETSLRIHIRHVSDNEWKLCTSNKKTLFELFLQFFEALERTLSSSFDSRNAWKWKQAHYTKRRTYSSCIWHPSKGSFHNEKKKEKKCAGKLHPRAHMYELQLQRGEERPHGATSSKPSCQPLVCVWIAL